jgi:hypothetical protein
MKVSGFLRGDVHDARKQNSERGWRRAPLYSELIIFKKDTFSTP